MVHGDLKMQNILIARALDSVCNVKYVPKIADFGLATQRSSSSCTQSVAGTRTDMAPEALDGFFSEKSDVYSFGHVMLGTFCPKRALGSLPDFVVGKVSLPSMEIVRSWLVEEWKGIDDCISEQHCRDAALCICACMHINHPDRRMHAH
eukprot:5050713-Amphidinium_carterae.1